MEAVVHFKRGNLLDACFAGKDPALYARMLAWIKERDKSDKSSLVQLELERARLLLDGIQHSIRFADKPIDMFRVTIDQRFFNVCVSTVISALVSALVKLTGL